LVSWLPLFLNSKTIRSRIPFLDFLVLHFRMIAPTPNNMSEQKNQSIWWLDIAADRLFFLLKKTHISHPKCESNRQSATAVSGSNQQIRWIERA